MNSHARWLADSPLLQHDHPRVRLLGMKLTQLRNGDACKAEACAAYVARLPRVRVASPQHVSSLDVLRTGRASGLTAATLLIALLRSLQIPSRLLCEAPTCGAAGLMGEPQVQAWIDGGWRMVGSGQQGKLLVAFDDVEDYCRASPQPPSLWSARTVLALRTAFAPSH